MSRIASYYLSGLYVEDFSIEVPLDWQGADPADLVSGAAPEAVRSGERIDLFYRTICAADRAHDDLPLLIYLQGGPGGEGDRPTSPSSPGWLCEALKHYRVVMPDQRGCGRSSRVDGTLMERRFGGDGRTGADFLKRFLADSIVRDFEYLRLARFPGKRWSTIGVSYGGFLTLTYLSLYPEGVAASFVYSGIPGLPADIGALYRNTFPRMRAKSLEFYRRFPGDEERVSLIADILADGGTLLPDGSPFTVGRLQQIGTCFGMMGGYTTMHWLLDQALREGDGSVGAARGAGGASLSQCFLSGALSRVSSSVDPLYWPLQEFIFCNGEVKPCRWAAARECARHPEFSADARPLLFFGEATFPWMFELDPALVPFKPAVDVLMEETSFGRIYDERRLAANDVPLYACVNHDDLYVPADISLSTLDRVGSTHAWVQNEWEHNGIVVPRVFERLFGMAQGAGDLEGAL